MVLILILYGIIAWLSAVAYALITGMSEAAEVMLAGPFIISAFVTVVVLLDMAILAAINWRRDRARLP